MTPQEWNAALAPTCHWKHAYPVAEREARSLLSGEWDSMSTNELAERLYPVAQARGDVGTAARKRLFQALMTLATHTLADCATRSVKPKRIAGKLVYPWLWHASTTPSVHEPKVCPCCKRPL